MRVWEWEDKRKDTYTLIGPVRAEEDGRMLAHAVLTLKVDQEIFYQVYSDSKGQFRLEIPKDTAEAKRWTLEVEYLGRKFINTDIQSRHQNLHIQIKADKYLPAIEISAASENVMQGRISAGVPVMGATIEVQRIWGEPNMHDPLKGLKKYGPHGQWEDAQDVLIDRSFAWPFGLLLRMTVLRVFCSSLKAFTTPLGRLSSPSLIYN